MSLIVSTYHRDKNDKVLMVDAEDPASELAGFEGYRHDFYASDAVKSLGCTLLPTLATEDIYADGELLDKLEREVQSLLNSIAKLSAALGWTGTEGEEHYRVRLNNIMKAIQKAHKHPSGRGGVYIG